MFHLLSVHSVGSPALGKFSSSFLGVVAYLSLRNQTYEERPAPDFVWYSAISQTFLLDGTSFLNVPHTSPLPSGNKFWIKLEHPYGHSLLLSPKAAPTGPFQTCFTLLGFSIFSLVELLELWIFCSPVFIHNPPCEWRHCSVLVHVSTYIYNPQ
jgi:hypothetical protein